LGEKHLAWEMLDTGFADAEDHVMKLDSVVTRIDS